MPRKPAPKKPQRKIGVIDFETDPFLYGRIPKPFCADFYDGENHRIFWGADCVAELCDFLEFDLHDEFLIFAHNGGKFDFHFMLHRLANPVRIINARIVSAKIGPHELRDSYAAIPIPLASYKKDGIDYSKFEDDVREKHRAEITEYLKMDCVYLHELCSKFCERFESALTVGTAAIKELRKIHEFETVNKSHDDRYRQFYYGGRVQCFQSGIIETNFKIYDVNSMYPHVMKNFKHPTGKNNIVVYDRIMDKKGRIVGIADAEFYFCKIHATIKNGGLPVREKTGLDFSQVTGVFLTTSHEIKVLIKYDLIAIHRVIEARAPRETITFCDFVDKFSEEKIDGKKSGNKIKELFSKFMLNSAYGKFGQNPENYKDWYLSKDHPGEPWELERESGEYCFFSKPVERHSYYDVAIGASITSAARSVLLEALINSVNPIYCDTDSIICSELKGVELHSSNLGAWKLEGEGDLIAVAGKKMYAAWSGSECIKSASKGANIAPKDILRLARGERVTWKNAAPTFSLLKGATFIERNLGATW